jgi:hypothetical protein
VRIETRWRATCGATKRGTTTKAKAYNGKNEAQTLTPATCS